MSGEGSLLGGGVYLKYRYRISFFPVCSHFLLLPKQEKERKWPVLSAQAGESESALAKWQLLMDYHKTGAAARGTELGLGTSDTGEDGRMCLKIK